MWYLTKEVLKKRRKKKGGGRLSSVCFLKRDCLSPSWSHTKWVVFHEAGLKGVVYHKCGLLNGAGFHQRRSLKRWSLTKWSFTKVVF